MNLGNCPRCGKLFANNFRDICPSCIKEIEQEYEKCLKFLREEKMATIQEVSEATGVSIKQITKFIKEGRITVADNPNMMYPCEVCGVLIRQNNMCDSCRTRLTRDFAGAAREGLGNEQDGTADRKGSGAYGAVDKFRN
ncbi:TIGR03826 family flagellar region protein [Paenibacillus ihumii]|uniref:TIGR03826 family flagellar region protein n=1 Tax=Paenibacillus ihumii TaxID=687436 RepID=UPI0006D77A45|nr:TIGR03826 family flagellar region protein [Paenibacillus ihumii]